MSIDIFASIARRYDLVNTVLSLGMQAHWRRVFLKWLPSRKGLRVLDLATGTGDVAFVLLKDPRVVDIVGVDISVKMLEIARKKAGVRGVPERIHFLMGDACALLHDDNSMDVVTVAFGLRNLPDLMKGLSEAYRVLSPDGVFIAMEFARPSAGLQRLFFRFYVRGVIPIIGGLLTWNWKAYLYLAKTIFMFPYGERMEHIIRQVGFRDIRRREIAMGAVNVYIARK
jgi:demethylmenaquinone methyltransferase / 2-methoxy-6-polyprenyl-1,4-benzoquinol methylase